MVNKNWDDDENCDCSDDCGNKSYDFTVEKDDSPDEIRGKINYKCPDFPNCPVCTPFQIRISTPEDMEHFMKYHEV